MQKILVMDIIGVKEKAVRNDVLDMRTKILELYDSDCSLLD